MSCLDIVGGIDGAGCLRQGRQLLEHARSGRGEAPTAVDSSAGTLVTAAILGINRLFTIEGVVGV